MATRPNILHILVDDMGYGDFACLNGGLNETPALDQLMGESHCLGQHYTASPVCNPSRAALLTGRYPHRTGSIDTLEWRGLERLNLEETTFADVLHGAGYCTGLVGKWHLGAFDPRYKPERRGFDEAVCFRGGMHDYYDWRIERGDRVLRADGRYMTDLWTDEAITFINRHQRDPFYLHLTYNAPHTPLQAPEEELAIFAEREDLPPKVRALYAMIRRLDTQIGRLLEHLDQLGLRDNTIVIFSSDNGPQLGGEGENSFSRFNAGLHGGKGTTYDGGIRVPAVIRWPDGLPGSGFRNDAFFHMVDWFPTLFGLLGLDVPQGINLDGIDQSALLRGEGEPIVPERCWQWNRYTPEPAYNAAIRSGDWKLVRPRVPEVFAVPDIHLLDTSMYEPEVFIQNGIVTDPDPERELPPPPPSELYNLADDPNESNNLAETHPDQVSRLESKLDAWAEDVLADLAKVDRFS